MANIQLTSTQQQVLEHAALTTNGRIDWFPDNVVGGARKKVLMGLFNRALITSDGGINWYVAAEGYDALGCARPGSAPVTPMPNLEADVVAAEASWALRQEIAPTMTAEVKTPLTAQTTPQKTRTRETSKQATVINMLKRAEGATIAQICEVTSWQAHTVRGTLAGAFKKKLGLNITSDKTQGGERTYRVT